MSAAERSALRENFPDSQLLLCQFHVLQAAWRYLWNASNEVLARDCCELFGYIKRLVHASSESTFHSVYDEMLANDTVQKYPGIINYVKKLYERRQEWSSYYRVSLLTRGQNTNNISEAAIKVSII